MVARKVIKWPDPRLLKKSQNADPQSQSTSDLALDLYHTMIISYGAGIAAPQIGVHENVCVLSRQYAPTLPKEEKLSDVADCVVLVNPEVDVLDSDKFKWEESCLSVPEVVASIERNQKVLLKYYNLDGQLIEKTLEGIESATIQHETDHLVGKLFIHRLKGMSRQTAMRKLRRYILENKSAKRKITKKATISEERRHTLRKKRKKKRKSFGKNKK